jgi:hypothetical protein
LATEGLGQKIPLHQELADFGVQLLDLDSAAAKQQRHLIDGLTLPLADQVRMHAMFRGQLRQCLLAPDRLQ